MRRIITLVLLATLVLALAVPLAGCGKLAEKAAEKAVEEATGVKVDADNDKVTFTGEDGSTAEISSEGGEYPDGFPEDFPQYGDAKIEAALKTSQDGKDVFTVTLMTTDDAAEVFDWYRKELEGEGWAIETEMNATTQEDAYATVAVIKDTRRGTVTISRGADDSESSVLVGINPKE